MTTRDYLQMVEEELADLGAVRSRREQRAIARLTQPKVKIQKEVQDDQERLPEIRHDAQKPEASPVA